MTQRLRVWARAGRWFIWEQLWRAARAVPERWFDYRYHVTTRGLTAAPSYLEARNGTRYEGVQPWVFRRALSLLPIDPTAFTFVDIGAGKGKAMLLAARQPFKRVIGVEIRPELARAAEANMRDYTGIVHAQDIDVVTADGATFRPPPGPLVLYLNNPFGPAAIEQLLDNVYVSLADDPRPAFVLYLQHNFDDVILARDGARMVAHDRRLPGGAVAIALR